MRNETLSAIEPLVAQHQIFILLGDLGVYQCKEIFSNYPNNIINYGIMEQSMLGVSAGLSSSGMYPIVYSITPFLIDRAYEQIKLDLVYNNNPCLLISAGASFDYAKLGPTHYCPHDISALLLLSFPLIFLPFTVADSLQALNYSVVDRRLSYLRLSSSTLSMSEYSWLSLDDSNFQLEQSQSSLISPVKFWKSAYTNYRALVLFSPDSQYLPSYEQLINQKTDVICMNQISHLSLRILSFLCSSYHEIDIMAPFESSALIEKLFIELNSKPCRLNIHTISNEYADCSSTKKSLLTRLYKRYSLSTI
jgi:hypothetical protein